MTPTTATKERYLARSILAWSWFLLLCAGAVYGFSVNGPAVRYVLGVICLVSFAAAVAFWWVIHPWIGFWRRVGMIGTYVAAFSTLVAVGIAVYLLRDWLLGVDFGTNWVLLFVGLVIYGVCLWMELQTRQQLSTRTLVGVAELRNESSDKELLSRGMYQLVRHPRYLTVVVGMIGFALVVNYLGTYLLAVLLVPGLYSIAVLEERELLTRFGPRYQAYARDVPRLFPTAQSFRNFWAARNSPQ